MPLLVLLETRQIIVYELTHKYKKCEKDKSLRRIGGIINMPLCCDCCFNDQALKEFIKEKGKKGYCDFCETEREYCIVPSELQDIFRPVVNLYAPVEKLEQMKGEEIGYVEEHYEDFLWEMLQKDWKVFFPNNSKVNEKLIRTMFPNTEKSYYPSDFLDSYVYNWVDSQTKNSSDKIRYKNWWKLLTEEIKHENRFFPRIPKWFLEDSNKLFSCCVKILKKHSIFYRAQNSNISRKLSCDEMGKPPPEDSRNGRGNPKGISYLYLASNENTAVSEVKPYINDIVTVGKFIVNNELSVIDLRNPQIGSPFKYGEELGYYIENLSLLKSLDSELSRPVNASRNELDYLPTQYLCELIKSKDYDGLIYNSFLGDGYNILIYNDNKLKCIETWTVEVKNIKHEYQKVDHRLLDLDEEIRDLYRIRDKENE